MRRLSSNWAAAGYLLIAGLAFGMPARAQAQSTDPSDPPAPRSRLLRRRHK